MFQALGRSMSRGAFSTGGICEKTTRCWHEVSGHFGRVPGDSADHGRVCTRSTWNQRKSTEKEESPPSQQLVVPCRAVTIVKVGLDPIHILGRENTKSIRFTCWRHWINLSVRAGDTSPRSRWRRWRRAGNGATWWAFNLFFLFCHLPVSISPSSWGWEVRKAKVLVKIELLDLPFSQHTFHLKKTLKPVSPVECTSGSHLSRALARKLFAEEENRVSAASLRSSGGGATWRPWVIVKAGGWRGSVLSLAPLVRFCEEDQDDKSGTSWENVDPTLGPVATGGSTSQTSPPPMFIPPLWLIGC